MKRSPSLLALGLLLSLCYLPVASAAESDDALHALQTRWAEINYRLPDKEKDDAFTELTLRVKQKLERNPNDAGLWIWSGIIKSTHAGAVGGLGALSLCKAAKADLEKAIDINGSALNGAAYTTLGSLYYQVPGWPIGFGSDKKAENYLRKGLAISDSDIDANYFYADFLFEQGDYSSARHHLNRALQAPPRPGRPLAD